MEGQIIISISREFGSGGHDIARKIADDLGIKFYDRNMLDEIAVAKNTTADKLSAYDEKSESFFSKRFGSQAAETAVAKMQFNFIHKRAELGESFVVVGRCADVVLDDFDDIFKIFVMGNHREKLARVMKKYKMNERNASALMEKTDKQRRAYHNRYAPYKWGDSRAYQLCINSSPLGEEKTAEIIEDYIKSALERRQ